MIGLATGLTPCPSILVAYLASISHGNFIFGFKAVVYFAIGMALSLLGVVLLFTLGGKKMNSFLESKSLSLNWNKIQGVAFIVIGLVTTFYQSGHVH